jgi:hypothetical protein
MSKSIFGTPPTTVAHNFVAHSGQDEVSEAIMENFATKTPEEQAAIIEIIASRGWGKTLYICGDILHPFLAQYANVKAMWVAPTYQVAMSPIDDVYKGVNEDTGERWIPEFCPEGNRVWEFVTTQSGPVLRYFTGSTCVFKSADSPDSIVSRGYNLIIIDEAAMIEERVFTQQIMGTARKKGIRIFIITSPRGKRHWTYRYFLKGQDAKDTNYLSFQQPWHKNPYFSDILKRLMKDLPEWIRRQEYEAEFLDDGDSLFKNLPAVLTGEELTFESNQQMWSRPLEETKVRDTSGAQVTLRADHRRFVVALDLAKSIDFTVLIVMDIDTGEIVYYRRLNKTDYRDVIKIAVEVCHFWNNAELIFDATGVGAGISDFLNNYDVVAHPYIFTNDSKAELINRLALAIEYQEITIPNIVTVRNEMEAFTYSITRTGKMSYGAPAGFHDDIVIAIALANWFRKENNGANEVLSLEDFMNITKPKKRSFLEECADDND